MSKQTLGKTESREIKKEYMCRLYRSGMSYEKIGEVFGVSRQRVFQIIGGADERLFREITAENCVFVGLRKWLNDNKVSINELTRRFFGAYHPRDRQRLLNNLRGKGVLLKTHIDKLLKITGLTYEEAFEIDAAKR